MRSTASEVSFSASNPGVIPGVMIEEDRACPKCHYNVRGMAIGNPCPECGRAIYFGLSTTDDHPLSDAPYWYLHLTQASLWGLFFSLFAAGAVWGANHNWAEVQQRRLRREGENPVPHYWQHVHWAFGAHDMDDFLQKAAGMTLEGHLQHIRVPFLVTHGARDRQIPVDYAHASFAGLLNSPKRELKLFTDREGGVEHVGADNMSFARDFIADWLAEQLGGKTR